MEIVDPLALHHVHDIPHKGSRLEGLEHLRPAEERHVPLTHCRHKRVGLRQVPEICVAALLALVEHSQQLGDLFYHRRHWISSLLRFVEEVVQLELFKQIGLCGLDEDRPLPPGFVEHVLALDVLKLFLEGFRVVGRGGGLLLEGIDLIPEPAVLTRQLAGFVSHFLDLHLQRRFLLFLAVDAAGQVGILSLQLTYTVIQLRDFLLSLLLCSLGDRHVVLDLLVFLFQHHCLLLSLLPLLLG
mmetsp:Transcript_35238/g.81228  ORF Transcript_35238/g.81228 Transcript_35238/m.81228 type:complete len:242 (+) Transcript_35238:872-1597(+)